MGPVPRPDATGTVKPFETYDVGEMNCRRYTHTVFSSGRLWQLSGAACKEQDGTWRPLT